MGLKRGSIQKRMVCRVRLPLKSHAAKLFYAQKTMEGRLGKRDLRQMIARKAFERTTIADAQLAPESPVPYNCFEDPYLFDFLGLKDDYLKNDLEAAILRELESSSLNSAKVSLLLNGKSA